MKCSLVAVLVAGLAGAASAAEQVAQGSGDWSSITWAPGPVPAAADVVHIEGGFTVNYRGDTSPSLGRLYVGDNAGGFSSLDGKLEISDGTLMLNANAAGAIIVARADGSNGAININGGSIKGVGVSNGTGLQIGFGFNSTGSVVVDGGDLELSGGVVIGYGGNSTGHFEVSNGNVTVSTNVEGQSFNVGGRAPGSNTATYLQTGGSVTIANSAFRVGYAGATNQQINGSAKITGGTFVGNVQVGRQASLKVSTGGGTLTIGSEADVSGRELAWEVSGDGKLIFILGAKDTFKAVDLTHATADNALVFPQEGARITVDGSALKSWDKLKPIVLLRYAAGKGPTPQSKSNVTFDYTGFDKRLTPALVWVDNSLQLKLSR